MIVPVILKYILVYLFEVKAAPLTHIVRIAETI